MSGGMYTALTGMLQRMDELDRVASDLANVGTAGYKREQAAVAAAPRTPFVAALESAIDVVTGETRVDFRPGTIVPTGRDLDVAVDGAGFFEIETAAGPRYTRNGAFTRGADGRLLHETEPVLGVDGRPIRLGQGQVHIETDGTVRVGEAVAGRLRLVTFRSADDLVRESGLRFRARTGAEAVPAEALLSGGALEQSNVTVVDRMAALTSLTRSFEGLQRGLSVLVNDVDGRAISEFGRRG
jgi:flagellar basal-body rod protein FlgF